MMINYTGLSAFVRIWLLGVFKVERRGNNGVWEEVKKDEWDKDGYAKKVLKWLLCASQRRAQRGRIIEELWSDTTAKTVEGNLNKAVSVLRKIFSHEDLLKTYGPHAYSGYELAHQSQIWTDVDEALTLLQKAETLGYTSVEALTQLQEAITYFDRGEFLEGETGIWCHARRNTIERMRYRAQIWLAEAYEEQAQIGQAELLYCQLLEQDPADEDVLRRLMEMLYRQGMHHEALRCYNESKQLLKRTGLELSSTIQKFATSLSDTIGPDLQGKKLSLPRNLVIGSSLAGVEMLMKSRRQMLQSMVHAAFATLVVTPSHFLPQESIQRLEMAKIHLSYIDLQALDDLGAITARYWTLASNISIEILSGVSGHFSSIIQFLKGPHPDPIYRRLCLLAGENALILGSIFHEIKEYNLAWTHYKFALKVAYDTQDADLWGASAGRIALLQIYWGEPESALPLLKQAQLKQTQNQRIGPWLSSIEAEIYSMQGNEVACLRALEVPRSAILPVTLHDDLYHATGFGPSRAAGYQGACFMLLGKPELALPYLEQAHSLRDSTAIRRLSGGLADLGIVHAQLGDPKQACQLLLQSIELTMQTKSLVVLQRIYKGRGHLSAWEKSAEVKELDNQIAELFKMLTTFKEKIQI